MQYDKNTWKQLSSKVIFKNPWFQVREDKIIRPDGSKGEYSIIETPESVEIVAITKKQEVYLVGQYRYPIGKFAWTVPGGSMNAANESLLEAAKRELLEETGLMSDNWVEIGQQYDCSGYTNKLDHIFLAKNVEQTNIDKKMDDGITKVEKISYKKVLEMIRAGEINIAETVAALILGALILHI